MFFATTLMAAAIQVAPPAPPAPPALPAPIRTVREIVVVDGGKGDTIRLPQGEGRERTIVIMREGKPGQPVTERREIRVHRLGEGKPGAEGARAVMIADCKDGHSFATEAAGKKDGKDVRTQIRLCHKGKSGNPAAAIDGLEQASKRIAENKELPADVRDKVIASLAAEIARLKAAK